MERCKKMYEQWQKEHPEGEFLKFAKNTLDDYVFAVYSNNAIYLLGGKYQTVMFAPKMLISITDDVLKIEDILCKQNNIGNGSILMESLFIYCNKHNISKITGYLSPVDNDHKDRRSHFYEKFGFEIGPKHIYKELINSEKDN